MVQSDDYPLATGYRAASRLNLQHYLWKQHFGYLTHPNIDCLRGENIKIADVGTGTGIWLLDLSESLPASVQLHGFDVNLSQVPPKQWLPPNVSMRELNIYEEIPDDLLEQYDVIHVRFFICVVKDKDPIPILQNLMKMLKPKGWIQWTELDLRTTKVVSALPHAKTECTETLKNVTLSPVPRFPTDHASWTADLATTFIKMGLQDVVEDRRKKLSWHLPCFEDVTMLAMEEISLKLPNGEAIRAIVQNAAQVFENNERGVVINSDRLTIIGQKP